MQSVDLTQPFAQQAFADLIGVSQPAVSAAVAEGRVDDSGSLAKALSSYIAHIREVAAGRGGVNAQLRLAEAKAEEAEVKTALNRIEYHKRIGTLVTVETVERALTSWAHQTHREIRSCFEKVFSIIESEHKITLNQKAIDEVVETAIKRIGDFSSQCLEGCDESGEGV